MYVQPHCESELNRRVKKTLNKCYRPCTNRRLFLQSLLSFVPIIEWIQRYSIKDDLISDIIGGLTVSIMSIPQGVVFCLTMTV
jgi:hypothetical protein